MKRLATFLAHLRGAVLMTAAFVLNFRCDGSASFVTAVTDEGDASHSPVLVIPVTVSLQV